MPSAEVSPGIIVADELPKSRLAKHPHVPGEREEGQRERVHHELGVGRGGKEERTHHGDSEDEHDVHSSLFRLETQFAGAVTVDRRPSLTVRTITCRTMLTTGRAAVTANASCGIARPSVAVEQVAELHFGAVHGSGGTTLRAGRILDVAVADVGRATLRRTMAVAGAAVITGWVSMGAEPRRIDDVDGAARRRRHRTGSSRSAFRCRCVPGDAGTEHGLCRSAARSGTRERRLGERSTHRTHASTLWRRSVLQPRQLTTEIGDRRVGPVLHSGAQHGREEYRDPCDDDDDENELSHEVKSSRP